MPTIKKFAAIDSSRFWRVLFAMLRFSYKVHIKSMETINRELLGDLATVIKTKENAM